jgi:hypothetical protein
MPAVPKAKAKKGAKAGKTQLQKKPAIAEPPAKPLSKKDLLVVVYTMSWMCLSESFVV